MYNSMHLQNGEISPCSLCWNFGKMDTFLAVSKREIEISVPLHFPRENYPFSLNFHAIKLLGSLDISSIIIMI